MKEAVKQNSEAYCYASDLLQQDKDIILAAIQNTHSMDTMVHILQHTQLQDDKDIVLVAVKQVNMVLEHVSDRLKNDRDVVLEAVKHKYTESHNECVGALQFASIELRNDKQIALTAIQYNKKAIRAIPKTLKMDPDVINVYVS